MERRSYLGALVGSATVATAGCLGSLLEDEPEDVVLDPPDDQLLDSENLDYPAYGESLPLLELPAPLSGDTVDAHALDRTALITGFFAMCPAECGILLGQLAAVQERTIQHDLIDSTAFLPITFDPERDDAEMLRENAELLGIDIDAGNWHYLRPETAADAEDVVQDRLGIEFDRVSDSDRVDHYDFEHIVVTLLVNPGGTVERAYRGERLDVDRVFGDVETVIAAYDPEVHG